MSLLLAATPLADDGQIIVPQIIQHYAADLDRDEYDLTAFEVIIATPLEDAAASEDYFQQPVAFDDKVSEFDGQDAPFWAIGPPDQDDEWIGAVALEAAEAEPEQDYGFAVSPPDDATVDETIIPASLFDAGEPVEDPAEAFALCPLDDAPSVVVPTTPPPTILGGPMHWSGKPIDIPRPVRIEPEKTVQVWIDTKATQRALPRVTRARKEVWKPKAKRPAVTEYDDTADLLAILLATLGDDEEKH